MKFEKSCYDNGHQQIYAVGTRHNKNDTLKILAEFRDVYALGYCASNEADKFLASLCNAAGEDKDAEYSGAVPASVWHGDF